MMTKSHEYLQMKERQAHTVCRQCGNNLEIRMIIFCQYGGQGIELYCPKCERIEYGIEKEIYDLAKDFLEATEFNYFMDMEQGIRNEQLNTSKICEIFGWLFKKLEFSDKHGLTEKYHAFYDE